MKKIIFIVFAIILITSAVHARPFLVCDPQPGVTHYRLTGPSWVPALVPAQADGSIRLDVSSANFGENSLTVAACINDELWGELCSEPVNFFFVRPQRAVSPSNMRLSK